MTTIFRNRAASPWLLSLVAVAAVALMGCTPAWMTRTSELLDSEDFDGAYAEAAAAQQANTSPTNYVAALMAGASALRGNRLQLAEEHLRFAASTDASNPTWVQSLAWETIASAKLRIAIGQMAGEQESGGTDSPDAPSDRYRQASATMADAYAAMTMAIDVAEGSGNKERAERLRVTRASLRGIRDSLNVLSEIPGSGEAAKDGGASAATAVLNAELTGIQAIFAAIEDLCDECDAKKRKARKDPTDPKGSGGMGSEPATAPSVN